MRKRLLNLVFLIALGLSGSVAALELFNPTMEAASDDQEAPNSWACTMPENHAVQRYTCRSPGAAWVFWRDGSIYQWSPVENLDGKNIRFGGYLRTPADDRLRRGKKNGRIVLNFYTSQKGTRPKETVVARPIIAQDSQIQEWIEVEGFATVPPKTRRIEFVVSSHEGASGEGVFFVDDVFLELLDE